MTVEPRRLDEVVDVVRTSAPKPLLFTGGGTKKDWGRPVRGEPYVVGSGALAGIVEHDPGDMTATVLAGTPLVMLQRHLLEHRQWLAIDPPLGPAAKATVGGIFSAQDSGPSRAAYGSLRELVIGMTVVLSDGTVARSGGKVIKNVAGFDLCKLFCGALGTLGFVYSVTVRVHPLPEERATIEVRGAERGMADFALHVARSAMEPAAVELLDDRLLIRLDATSERLRSQVAELVSDGAEHGLDAERLSQEAADMAWSEVSRAIEGVPGETVVRVSAAPARLVEVRGAVREAAAGGGVSILRHAHAGLGLHTVRVQGSEVEAHARFVDRLRDGLVGFGRAVVRCRPEGAEDVLDIFGPAPAAAFLMRRVRAKLDPGGRCAPGRLEWELG